MVFSGPAKTDDELILAIRNRDRVTVLLDSLGEMERLELLAGLENAVIQAGVRLTTDERGLWRKFGIPLSDLAEFMEHARGAPHVDLRGLQFHTSWNLDPLAHVAFIRRLGAALRLLPLEMRERIEFVDIGGGFWPPPGSWSLEPPPAGPQPNPMANAAIITPAVLGCRPARTFRPSASIGEFARRIGGAIRTDVFPHVRCRIYSEPGRWICNDAMHLLLTVLDRKGKDIVITDGGTNAVGWERFENEYFPVINLSRTELIERPFHVLGSLCTPHDVWGYSYYGSDIQAGDVLLIPAQGAYTYSLRQHFIKPLPRTVLIRAGGLTVEWTDTL
jgi:diaminopimelate decarboxylase